MQNFVCNLNHVEGGATKMTCSGNLATNGIISLKKKRNHINKSNQKIDNNEIGVSCKGMHLPVEAAPFVKVYLIKDRKF